MSLFKFVLLASCLLLLGFDLACDGSRQIRLRRAIEQQKDELRRNRQQLASLRSDYDAALLSITWNEPGTSIPEPIFSRTSSTDPGSDLIEVSLSLSEHLNLEKENRD